MNFKISICKFCPLHAGLQLTRRIVKIISLIGLITLSYCYCYSIIHIYTHFILEPLFSIFMLFIYAYWFPQINLVPFPPKILPALPCAHVFHFPLCSLSLPTAYWFIHVWVILIISLRFIFFHHWSALA